MKFQITFLGANSLFGRVSTALLSKTPYVRTLKLYDEVDTSQPGPTGIPTCQVQWHKGKKELTTAIQGSDIVVIGDDNKVILNGEKDALISSASKVVDFVYAVAQTSPKAMLVVAASPLNLMVPLAGYVLKEIGCYDGRKLLGVTSVDTLRANAIYSDYIDQANSILPVVGGASPQTRVPIFSHARPSLDLSEEDKHHLIDKIKSFDLNMEGPEFKASTLERAYATVRLVNSLLSGLREEPSTKEMALAKTSLIPEVNYFSLPVDLGKFGIERTFGLPQLSQLETEMVDYAIINLNNDLIKAQDLYASFKPCFEMLKSIVGCSSSRCSTDKASAMLSDSKTDIKKNKDQKTKERSIKRKRSEQHLRNRKRTRTNKFPIIHCPAPEVVTDKPIEEKFGKIERVHKKLQVNQIFQERNPKELPMLKSNKSTEVESSLNQLNDTRGSLGNVINESVVKSLDLTNTNNVSVPLYIKEDTKAQLPPLDNKSPKTIDLTDLQNNSKAIHKAANQKFDSKNLFKNMEILQDKPDIGKDVKVATDLKSKVKNNVYEHLQAQAQSQSDRIEMIKSLMLQKQNQNKKTKDLNFTDTTTSNDKMEYLKKKAMELKTLNNTRFYNKPNTPKLRSAKNHITMEGEYCNGTISRMQTNINSSMDKQRLGKLKQTNMTTSENGTVDKTQYISMKKCIELRNGTGISKKEIKTEIETKGGQETGISEKEVSRNEENDSRGLLECKGSINLIANDSINYEIERKIGYRSCSENIAQAEKPENVCEDYNKIKGTNEKVYKKDGKDILKSMTCDEINTSMGNNNISAADIKAYEINEDKIITKEKVSVPEVENGTTKNISDCITSNVLFGKNNETETREQKHIRVISRAETKKEEEKQLTEACRHEVNKKEDEKFNEEMSNLICEVADSNKTGKQTCQQQSCFTDEEQVVKEIEVQGKLKNEEYLSKRRERENLSENNRSINDAITSKVSCDRLEQINKDVDITIKKLKEPSKSPNILKLKKSSDKESVEEKVKEKKMMKTIETEETKEIKKMKASDIASKVPETIEVFNYTPQKLQDTRNITNINDIVQGLVKTSKPEAKSELPIVEQKPIQNMKDQVHVDSKPIRMKVMDLNKKAGQLTIKRKQQSKGKALKKGELHAKANIEKVELKKQSKETPFPITERPKEEGFDKNKWLQQRVQTVRKVNSSKKNLKNIDESKALTIYSRNINESFTKIVHGSNKSSNKIKSVSYAVDTKIKKDELSKRYTVLKKGQLCNMVKDDINANEVKAKLYQNSQINATIKPKINQDDNGITNVKGSFTESSKTLPTNKEISISGPSPDVLTVPKNFSYNLRKDVNNLKNANKGNNNSITLNKSFLNLVINRISKRSPTLNEKSEAIGVRGSHYGSGRYSKPNKSDEEKIQQLTKRAKEQLTLTKFKNNKRISQGLSGSLPLVSNELSETRQPAKDKGLDKSKSPKDVTDNMMWTKNKIQLMKERHQRLRNENQLPNNFVKSPPPTGIDIVKSKDKKIGFYGIKNPITEISNKSSSKSSREPKYEVKKDETESKQDVSHSENLIKEISLNAAGKTKSELNDQYHHQEPNEKDESLTDINTSRKQGINSTDALNKKHSNETEEQCSELFQNSTFFDNDDKTMIAPNKSTQENHQSSEERNKSIKECFDKKQESLILQEDDGSNMSNVKQLKEETIKKIKTAENKKNNPSTQQLTPRKRVFHDRAQEISKFKAKQSMKDSKDVCQLKKSKNTASKEKFQQPKMNLAHKNALMSVKSAKEKSKSANEHKQRAALQAVFSSRPTAWDLMKMKQEQKTDTPNITAEKIPPLNFGVRAVVGNNLIPRHSTASSLLIDPDIERRPTTSRKEIHPSLMHAVKPFHSQKTDLTKMKTNFYSRWTPQTLKMKGNKKGDIPGTKNELIQKNQFVSGKINLTSDLFKAYMKQNRNHEFANSNGDVQFLHQSGQLASLPQQGVSATTSRINDQRVAFSTLETNSEEKIFPKHELIKSKPKVSKVEKTSRSRSSLFSKSKRINNILKEAPSNEPPAKGKSGLQGSHRSLSKNKPVSNKSKEKFVPSSNPIRRREKEIDLKRIHLLKAFKNQDKKEIKFGELQRNYKKQLSSTPENSLKNPSKELSKEAPNRLQMLKGHSVESMKPLISGDKRHNKKPFSAPGDYHPSFPLSKPKKYENNNKKDKHGNSTLKKRWTQLLDIFQSVITTEKKNWEQDGPESNLLVVGGPHLPKSAVVPKAKIVLRETSPNPDSTGKRVQTYYKRHSVGGSKLQSIYPPANRTNKM